MPYTSDPTKISISIGNERTLLVLGNDEGEYEADSINGWAYQDFSFDTGDNNNLKPGYYNVTVLVRPLGNALPATSNWFATPDGTLAQVTVLPNISSLSLQQGSSQGAIITIDGSGFPTDSTQVTVSLGSQTAEVLSASFDQLKVRLPKSNGETGPFKTHAGLKVYQWDNSAGTHTIASLKSAFDSSAAATIATASASYNWGTAESPKNTGDKYIRRAAGWFESPITGNVKFYVSGDDQVSLYFNPVADSTTPQTTPIATVTAYTNYREFHKDPTNQISAAQSLTKGSKYWIEIWHAETTGNDHFSVGIGFDNGVASQTRPTNLATIFDIVVTAAQAYDEYTVVLNVGEADKVDSSWTIRYIGVDSYGANITTQTSYVSWNASDEEVASIFAQAFGASATVTHTLTLADGTAAADFLTADVITYTVAMQGRRKRDYTMVSSTLVANPTISQTAYQTAKLAGNFTINLLGTAVTIGICEDTWSVGSKFTKIPSIIDPLTASTSGSCDETGRTWRFALDGAFPKNVPVPTVGSTSITGGVSGGTVAITSVQSGSTTEQLWGTIPPYLLQASSDSLEVTVKVGDFRAIATGSALFSYLADSAVPTISAVSRSGATLTVTLDNVLDSAFSATKIDYFAYSGVPVTVTSVAATGTADQYTITATLATNSDGTPVIVAGDSTPEISITGIGFAIPSASLTLADINLLPTASAVSPSTGSTWGFTSITITGSYFGYSLSNSFSTSVTIGGAACTITALSNTQISCVTGAQASGSDIVINVNGKSNTLSGLFTYTASGVPTYTTSSPASANPTLQTTLSIDGSFGASPTASDFTVYLDALDSAGTTVTQYGAYQCYVNSVTSTTLECILAGGIASPTLYNVRIIVSGIGAAIGTSGYPKFQFLVQVTSISPSSGSMAGGTLLTISGVNFPTDISQNQVTIGEYIIPCTMVSATSTEITCLTGPADSDYTSDAVQPVYVLSRIQDEATCSPSTACQFTYSSSKTPTVTAVNALSGVAGDTIVLTGTNLNADSSESVTVTVGGVSATVDSGSLSSTSVSFTVPGALAYGGSYTIQVRVGNKGYATFSSTSLSLLTITGRKILDVNPKTLSQGGGVLTITGGGFNASTDTVTVNGVATTLVSITLDTIKVVVAPTTSASLSVAVVYSGGSVTAPSSISTSTSVTPVISDVVVSGTSGLSVSTSSAFTLDFTGSNLALEAPTVILTDKTNANSVYSSTLSTTPGATSFSAPFTNVVAGTYSLTVSYPNNGYAQITLSPSDVTVEWTTPTASPTTVSSGIAGGAEVTITGNGFPSSSQIDLIDFRACGVEGEVVSTSATQIVVRVPPFITPLSLQTYDLAKVEEIFGTAISDSNPTGAASVSDGVFATYYSSSATNCYIGVDFGANSVGILSKIKYFPQIDIDTTKFYGTQLQGSNDGTTWTGVQVTTTDSTGVSTTGAFTIGYSVHNGYNDIIFDETNKPSYRYYRFLGNGTASQCNFAEIQFWGILASSKTPTSLTSNTCDGVLTINGKTQTFTGLVNYQSAVTPKVTDVNPPFASANGGESITITGTGFPAGSTSNAAVTIDGTVCDVDSVTSTTVVCTTRAAPARSLRPESLDSSIKVWFNHASAAGYAAGWQSLYFLVIERWTGSTTWGGLPAPGVGDSVYVPPGLSLLVDTNVNVYAVVIEGGALVFSDEADYTFDAHYVFVRQGIFRAGTPERPYKHKLTITMHGTRYDPQLPTYGNKNIAVREGILDLNGIPRTPTWTMLYETASSGSSTIKLLRTVDWQAGEEIVLASSTHEHGNSETAVIASATNTTVGETTVTQLTLTAPLKFNHYSKVLTYTKGDGSSESISLRTEVGLLSRNIIFQGDDESPNIEYGAHMMIHSPGDESSVGRVSYIRVRHAGQAHILGRYAIHFHLIGQVSKSFVKGNAIHNTFNRATTIHGVHYLTVEDNVVYRCKGHNIFIEDGIETNNLIQNNLVISTLRSWSLLDTDSTPASFWITNPNNMFIGNHAAGSDRYGFWFDLNPHPTGPSYTPLICPQGTRLGAFRDNVAHSNGRYGLRIFHLHTPTVDPCSEISETNPSVPATYLNFTGWKNKRAGIIGETLGELTFSNIKTADNLQSGVELSVGGMHGMKKLIIKNVLAVGLTENAADNGVNTNDPIVYNYYWDRPARGIVTSRNDGILVSDVRFYDWPAGTVAFMDCSHCESSPATDSGARTAFVEKVFYSSSFKGRKIQYNIPLRGIFRDLDGTMTGQIGWATAYFPHNDVPECTRDETNFNGLICTNAVQVRRIVFYEYSPNLFDGVPMYIFNCNNKTQGAILDHSQCMTYENSTHYDFATQASVVNFRQKQNPTQSWAVGFVTGYTYNPYWGPQGIDFDSMTFQNTPVYESTDKVITLAFNHSVYRETFDFVSGSLNLTNRTTTWTTTSSSCKYGDWHHDPLNKRLYVCVNGNTEQSGFDNTTNTTVTYNVANQPFSMTAIKCRVNCPISYQDQAREGFIRNWSVETDWMDNSTESTESSESTETTENSGARRRLETTTTIDPNASEVIIPASWRMRVDVSRIPQTPGTTYKKLEIRGDLVIDEVAAAKNGYIEIFAEIIWIRGNFLVGSNIYNETSNKPLDVIQPYNGKLRIYLTGSRNADGLTLSQVSSPGNKVLASTGLTYLVGKPKAIYSTKLVVPAKAGDTSIVVAGDATSWVEGDLLGISPTARNISEYEYITVLATSYDSTLDQTTITLNTTGPVYASYDHTTGEALKYDHYGCTAAEEVPGIGAGSFDLRADVVILSRDIVVTANELNEGTEAIDGWGASIYSSEVAFPDLVTQTYVNERGSLKLDNIQCDFCGQADTYQAAIHLENFTPNPLKPAGYLINSVISGSNGVGIYVKSAADFTFHNNVVFDVTRYGAMFDQDSENMVFTNNLVIGVKARNVTVDADHFTDLAACIYAEYNFTGNSSFENNIVAGCAFHGIIALGGVCGYEWAYKNNTARISDYPVFIKAPNSNCTYASGITAYGGEMAGVVFVYTSLYVIADNIITLDSSIGLVINQGVGESVGNAYINNVFIGGSYFPHSACYADMQSRGITYGGCSNRLGFLLGVAGDGGKELPPTPSKLPWYGIKATGAVGATHRWNNVTVKWFQDDTTNGCTDNYLFQSNGDASDNSAVTVFSNFTVSDLDAQRIAKFTTPGADWIGIDNCGNWPCTGIKNILVKDMDGSLTGTPSSIIPQNDGIVDSTCRLQGSLSYTCSSLNWAIMTFQSLDSDREERIFSPINITTSDGYTNDINSMMDHCWDGFYTCQRRMSRFPALVRTGNNYEVSATGTLPEKFQFQLFGATNDTDWVLANVHYMQGTAVTIQDGQGNEIKPKIIGPKEDTSFDSAGCGKYTFEPSTNYITFKLTGAADCRLTLTITNTVYASVRYAMSVDDFYSVNGPTNFIDNIAAVLQIPLYKIRVVTINTPTSTSSGSRRLLTTSGSTLVQAYFDLPDEDQGANSTTAAATGENYISLLTSALGAGLLAINGQNPDAVSFQVLVYGNSSTAATANAKNTLVIGIAVGVPVGIVVIALILYVWYKRAQKKRAGMSKIPKIILPSPKMTDTKIEPHMTEEEVHRDNSGLQNSNNESHSANRLIMDNKLLEDRIIIDNALPINDAPNKITLLPSAKHVNLF